MGADRANGEVIKWYCIRCIPGGGDGGGGVSTVVDGEIIMLVWYWK